MFVNLQAWDNFLGRSLIVFLMIEGIKTFPRIARLSARASSSTWRNSRCQGTPNARSRRTR